MGAGASAAEGRVFCHHCGARTACSSGADTLVCGSCGATDGVEATDARLPVTASSSSSQGAPRASGAGDAQNPVIAQAAVAAAAAAASAQPPPATVMRVESVTVVALHRPEDGGLLLRVLPNLVARRGGAGAGGGAQAGAAGSPEGEDWEAPAEPACAALVSRLQTQPYTPGSVAGMGGMCVICADEIAEAGTPVASLDCGHSFHDGCLRQWLARRHTCPTCRLELEVDDVRYLRSIGLAEEAEALEQVEQERQAREMEKQAAARRRWVESMRRGQPVHFGLACSRCALTPLVGDCYRCTLCEGYMLCSDCFAEREAKIAAGEGQSAASDEDAQADSEADHPMGHHFVPFGPGSGAAGTNAGTGGVPPGPGGLLTVLVPAPARPPQEQASGSAPEGEVPGEAALAAAEVAFAAVRSLALAPLAGASAPGASLGSSGGGSSGSSGSRWPHGRSRGR